MTTVRTASTEERARIPDLEADPPLADPYPHGKSGPKIPRGWQQRFLAELEQRPGECKAARAAGVSLRTVKRWRDRSPAFNEKVLEALELVADECERLLFARYEQLGVAALIVLLKKYRPREYNERVVMEQLSTSINLTMSAQINDDQALEALHRMLDNVSPPARTLLSLPAPPPPPPLPPLEPPDGLPPF